MDEFQKKALEAAKESAQDAGLTTSPMTERAGAYISGYHSGAEWARRECENVRREDLELHRESIQNIQTLMKENERLREALGKPK